MTARFSARMPQIVTECEFFPAFTAKDLPPGTKMPGMAVKAIWDTGAMGCVITQPIVDTLGLLPTGMVTTHGVHGSEPTETFMVNIRLPSGIGFQHIRVTKGKLPGGNLALIGMDIISGGDFALSHEHGNTVFSFRVPSRQTFDFVEQAERARNQAAASVDPRARGVVPSANQLKRARRKK